MRLTSLLTVLLLATSLPAAADLYSGGELSVEWLVDSSDEIVLIRVVKVEMAGQLPGVSVVRTLKGQTNAAETRDAFREADDQLWRLHKDSEGARTLQFRFDNPSYWKNARHRRVPREETGSGEGRSSEWLLFIRTDGVKRWLVKGFNVTRPTEHSFTAAITAEGVVLKSKEQILRHVKNRIGQHRQLPAGSQRKTIDNWTSHRMGAENWFENNRHEEVLLSKESVAQISGGFAVPVVIEYWDEPEVGDADEDLHLGFVIVPADNEYKAKLMQSIGKFPSAHELVALLNYPGKESELILREVAVARRGASLLANRLLEYLRYRRNPASTLDKKLLGKWTLEGGNESVKLNLRPDHSCSIDVRPTERTRKNELYLPIDGKGHWAINDGRLWIARTHVMRNGKWQMGSRQFFAPKRILSIGPDEVKLENGPPMKRQR